MTDNDDNVVDFVQHKLMRMAEQYASRGLHDVADSIYDALDEYIAGNIGIVFRKGMPYLQPLENIDDHLPPSPREVDYEPYEWGCEDEE